MIRTVQCIHESNIKNCPECWPKFTNELPDPESTTAKKYPMAGKLKTVFIALAWIIGILGFFMMAYYGWLSIIHDVSKAWHDGASK